ncbi:MAG TPA: hypothetical protein VIV14_00620 [Gammaproteobacteria bacterium]
MIYLKWTRDELATLETAALDALYTEIDEDGWVLREVGVCSRGRVIHQLTPSTSRPGWFGLARLSQIMLNSNVSKLEFEAFWAAGESGL